MKLVRNTVLTALMPFLCISTSAIAEKITVATVNNDDMVRIQELTEYFTKDNSDIEIDWVTLDENTLRQRVITDIATQGGQYDVVTIGTYEAPIWAQRGWLVPLDDLPVDYDIGDLLPAIRAGLSYDGVLYGAPFYGESSFTMYRTDLFDKAGLEMPEEPTWNFIKEAADKLNDRQNGISGICLRGKPGWGENMALLTAMANTYGARWFDMEWKPRLDSEAWNSAIQDYMYLLKNYGPPDPWEKGYSENLELFKNGNCAIWIDATVAASSINNPNESQVAGKVGFALAPDAGLGKRSNWIWAWSLAIPVVTQNKNAAKRFVAWATSKEYTQLVAREDGWSNVPPGTRQSLYQTPMYLQAAPFAEMTLASIKSADPNQPTIEEVPYTGVQYVATAEFQGIGTAVGQQFADALSGDISTEEALENAQWVTEKVVQRTRFIEQD